jgi:calcineurin-like phosphoesterase family protein
MSKIFLISDPHFYHANIIEYEDRPFKDVNAMNFALISRWNNIVSKKDKIICLGDFAFANKEIVRGIVAELNGYKVLVMGNHDRRHSVKWWLETGFNEVSAYPIIYKESYILSHEPVYLNSHMPYANIFGHVHGGKNYADYSEQGFCACAERIDYTPIEWNEIIRLMKGEK